MSEGSLEAPIRHTIPWNEKDYLDPKKFILQLRIKNLTRKKLNLVIKIFLGSIKRKI